MLTEKSRRLGMRLWVDLAIPRDGNLDRLYRLGCFGIGEQLAE